jgi:very-short-patch-repair endonuclease
MHKLSTFETNFGIDIGSRVSSSSEHALDPEAWERELQKGAYSIDLVVSGSERRLAIECDGEQFHGAGKLQEDLERQAILERLGWTFVRIRGSLFFQDEDRALQPLFRRFKELGVAPELVTSSASTEQPDADVVERIIHRAEELRRSWNQVKENSSQSAKRVGKNLLSSV